MVYGLMVTVVVTALCAFAPQGRGTSDPITGTWNGTFTPQGAESGNALTFQLKFDGKQSVSGTFTGLQSPGDVKKGTFDVQTGALHLELGKVAEPDVLLTLEGRVSKDVATGRFTGEMTGDFRLERKKA
jgi:hypothetical protein